VNRAPNPASRLVALALGSAIGYFVLARIGYAFMIQPASVAVWPASGAMLAGLVLLDRRYWPLALAGGFAGNLAADVVRHASFPIAAFGSAANSLEALVAAAVLIYACGRPITMGTRREVVALVVGAAGVSNGVTAFLGALVLSSNGSLTFWERWFAWWSGDGLGMLIVAPVILTGAALVRSRRLIPLRTIAEAALICLAIALIAYVALAGDPRLGGLLGQYPYLAFPLLLWMAVRFGPPGAAVAMLTLASITMWNASRGAVSLKPGSQEGMMDVLDVYLYLALASVATLIPASVIREQQVARRDLRESERRFRQMAEHINEAFFIVDLASGRALYVSPTWSQIWGRPLADGYDPHIWRDAIHRDDRAAMAASHQRVASGEPDNTVFRVVRPDDSVRWVRGRAYPVRDRSGNVYRFVGVAEDVTELRQVEQRAVQSQKMEAIGRLAGGVAHDFNNILTVIVAEADLLREAATADAVIGTGLDGIQGAAHRATVLTRQLLALSRHQPLDPEVFGVNEMLERMASLLQRLIGEHIELKTALQTDVGLVHTDRGRIEQVVTNLAVNARDAMPGGGQLHLRTGRIRVEPNDVRPQPDLAPGDYFTISVSDTGTGMSPEVAARAFEPFFTTKPRDKGTGLGLATSYGIMQQAGGLLTAYSEPGIGSTFRAYLPAYAGTEAETAERPPESIGTGHETIMLVEDDVDLRSAAARLLRAQGYDVVEPESPLKAVDLLTADGLHIDLLLTDVVMPGMNGRELADAAIALRPGLKVLFTSGYTDDIVLDGRLLGQQAVLLEKPLRENHSCVKSGRCSNRRARLIDPPSLQEPERSRS
jgi:PAS domain S-box-containing protein